MSGWQASSARSATKPGAPTDNEPDGHKTGWGLSATTAINARPGHAPAGRRLRPGHRNLHERWRHGSGADRLAYPRIADFPAAPLPLFELVNSKTVPLLGISAFVDLQWAKDWTSSIGYSLTKVDNTNFQAPEAFHKGEYALANLLWTPFEPVLTGLSFSGAVAPTMTGRRATTFACSTASNGRSRARTSGTWSNSPRCLTVRKR